MVVKDDSLSLAIGRRGVNVRLAVKLTGYNIDVKTESQALEDNLEFVSFEEIQAEEDAKREQAQAQIVEEQNTPISVLPGLPEGYVAPQDRVYEEESSNGDEDLNEALEAEAEKKEEKAEVEEAPVVEEVKEEKVEQPVKEEKPAKVEKKEETKREVKTTTSIEDLEKSLADESARKASKQGKKNFKKNNKKAEEEEEEDNEKPVIATGERMSIYTEEELRQMEEEDKEAEEEYEDEDIDYDDYDEYYEDDR